MFPVFKVNWEMAWELVLKFTLKANVFLQNYVGTYVIVQTSTN